MPILNFTTQVSMFKTVGQIQEILGSKGARSISIDYDEQGDPSALSFMIMFEGSPVSFRLPCNVDGVFGALQRAKGVPRRLQTKAHAARVAWRIIKDWVEAQLALVEARQAGMAEVFLPYAIDKEGRTFYSLFAENQRRQLNAAPDNVVEGKFSTEAQG